MDSKIRLVILVVCALSTSHAIAQSQDTNQVFKGLQNFLSGRDPKVASLLDRVNTLTSRVSAIPATPEGEPQFDQAVKEYQALEKDQRSMGYQGEDLRKAFEDASNALFAKRIDILSARIDSVTLDRQGKEKLQQIEKQLSRRPQRGMEERLAAARSKLAAKHEEVDAALVVVMKEENQRAMKLEQERDEQQRKEAEGHQQRRAIVLAEMQQRAAADILTIRGIIPGVTLGEIQVVLPKLQCSEGSSRLLPSELSMKEDRSCSMESKDGLGDYADVPGTYYFEFVGDDRLREVSVTLRAPNFDGLLEALKARYGAPTSINQEHVAQLRLDVTTYRWRKNGLELMAKRAGTRCDVSLTEIALPKAIEGVIQTRKAQAARARSKTL